MFHTMYKNFCPACGYPFKGEAYEGPNHMPDEAIICPSCKFQPNFTDTDQKFSFKAWRHQWIDKGMKWSSNFFSPPSEWSPVEQLKNIGVVVDHQLKIIEEPEDPEWHVILP